MEQGEEGLLHRLSLAPDDVEAENALGCLLLKDGRTDEGIAALRRAICIKPDHIDARRNLAFSLHHEERLGEAMAALRDWQRDDPENPVPRHMLAAFSGTAVPMRAEDDYVRLMFDRVASEFDDHIMSLGYRGPELIAAALERALGGPAGALDIVDAGCGTGLCGPALRPYAGSLIGVDLSSGMLAMAADRGCYEQLHTAELTAFLDARTEAFDAVVSADTLIYFGDLAPPLTAASRALRGGGWLFFTLEAAPASDRGSRLNPHGRYSHTEAYVQQAVAAAGLRLVSIAAEALRYEAGPLVTGFVVTARKQDTQERGETR